MGPDVLTCSICKLGTNTTRDGKCIECIARCSCEEALALRAEIETLRRGEGCHHPSCCRAVEKELSQLRELAGELVQYVEAPWLEGDNGRPSEDEILAKARALGVGEVGR